MTPKLLMVAPLLAIATLAGACGGSTKAGSSTSTTAVPSGSGNFAAARARFTSCLEAHGVPASEATQRGFGAGRGGAGGPGGPDGTGSTSLPSTPPTTTAAFGAAFAACRNEVPTGFGRGGNFANTAAGRAYLQCLQLHGVTIPTTTPGSAENPGAGPGGGFGGAASNPNFPAARAACAALAPNRNGGPGSTSSTNAGGNA